MGQSSIICTRRSRVSIPLLLVIRIDQATFYRVVNVGLTDWEPDFGDFLDGVYRCYPQNLDVNSGDPLGACVC